ncbi:MAG: hypothetical protein ACERKO_11595 [Acetanaerobacterium sp.]
MAIGPAKAGITPLTSPKARLKVSKAAADALARVQQNNKKHLPEINSGKCFRRILFR